MVSPNDMQPYVKNSDDTNSFISLGKEQIRSACSLPSSLPALCFLPVGHSAAGRGLLPVPKLALGLPCTLLSNMLQEAVIRPFSGMQIFQTSAFCSFS